MEFIFEFIFEIVFEGLFMAMLSKKVNPIIRIVLFTFLSIFTLLIGSVFISMIFTKPIYSGFWILGIIVSIIIIVLYYKVFKKFIRSFR